MIEERFTWRDININRKKARINMSEIEGMRLKYKSVVYGMKLLGHKRVCDILAYLLKGGGPRSVTQIMIVTRMDQSVTSQHLAKLRRYDIVKCTKDGKYRMYEVNHDELRKMERFVNLALGEEFDLYKMIRGL